ncbi:MAG: HAD-IA family hydrolase [Pseudomonadales bacterium]|nr:HAD-IA family hydrolase [Pseudomonadales bacterium]MCP5331179.1 HAD-IA family hydrolase [Pseudomonadales bacterium]
MPRPIQAVLFDLDGTLVDTAPDFRRVLLQMSRDADIAAPSDEAIQHTVSNGARALVQLAFAIDEKHPAFDERLATLLSLYLASIGQTQSALYPGMDILLRKLEAARIPWGVVTNKPSRYSHPLLQALGLQERCSVLICPDDVTRSKPDPEPLLLACTRLGVETRHTLYVGDHPRDIEAGRAAGMFTIAAAYGYVPAASDIHAWGADLIVDQAETLDSLLIPIATKP